MLSSEGHKDRACTDGGVEALGKSSLGAYVKVGCELLHAARKVGIYFTLEALGSNGGNVNVLFRTVGVKEFTADVNDLLAVPEHNESGLSLYGSNDGSLKVLAVCKLKEASLVFLLDNASHSLLRLTDSKLGAVKTVILLRYCIEVDLKSVGKLTDRNRNTACSEVVTSLDHTASLSVSEESLELSFLGSVTLLNLCTAGFKRGNVMRLGGSGSSAASVTSRSSAEENYEVSVSRTLTAYVFSGGSCDNRTYLKALSRISVMIKLVNHTGCKTDLVTVGGISCRRGGDYLSLGKLTLNGLGNGL